MPTVLSSKILSESKHNLLLNTGISYVEYNAIQIKTTPFEAPSFIENAIFSSKNAVKAILNSPLKIQQCFCVGSKTKTFLEEKGFKVAETADYGRELAQKIVQQHPQKKFVFFCGNKRRQEIPQVLTHNNIVFEEIEVYRMLLTPKKFRQVFDGILFFSPSAVQSFTTENSLKNSLAFCIGKTTASEAKKHTQNVIIANKTSIENVIVQVVKKLGT